MRGKKALHPAASSSLKRIRTPPQTFQIKPNQLCAAVLSASSVSERPVGSQQGRTEAEMSGHVYLSVTFSLFLLWGAVGVVPSRAMIIRDGQERSFVSLDDMFREVEELMEDTQNLLEDAVDQITTESAKSLENHHHHHSDTKTAKDGVITIQTDKEINNTAGETESSHIHVEISGEWNSVYHECLVDEDCGERKYCLYRIDRSKCLPCIPTDMPCTKNEECCSSQLCVWGQCTVNATEGTEGTICQGQNDCKRDLCCAFQRELLFPVCNPKPGEGEACLNQPNLLMDMLAWDQEGPRDHCPCANDLQCQPQGRGSVCMLSDRK